MKMECITEHELLTAYMGQHYADKDALVIFQEDADSWDELQTVLKELDDVGFLPPKAYGPCGILIIEMPYGFAQKLINDHNKGFVRMELFSNGVCVHENQ